MARQARVFSETGMYHVMFRGMNKQSIFSDKKDYEKMLSIISKVKDETDMQIYAYCIMPNHVHLFLREAQTGDISVIMKKILSHYAGWYNYKYERCGHLFANRYKSIPIEDDSYVLSLARYIHQNPLKAHLSEKLQDYEYSSYSDYTENGDGITDIDFLLDMLSEDRYVARKLFLDFSNIDGDDREFEDSIKLKDVAAKVKIIRVTGGMKPHEIRNLPKEERNALLKKLLDEYNIQQATLVRLTGISKKTISRL